MAGSLSESDFCRFYVWVKPASLESLSVSDQNLLSTVPRGNTICFMCGSSFVRVGLPLHFVPLKKIIIK